MIELDKEQAIYSMSRDNPPVIEIESGSQILFETCDCFSNQISSEADVFQELDWQRINPATGPVFVKGAEPGDLLRIDINQISFTRDYAVMVTAPNLGVVGDELSIPDVTIVPISNGKAKLPGNIEVSLRPMIGVIGVAPANGAITCGTPDSHGGNMDCKEIVEGSTLWLSVNVKGALFALGDLHAAMGDGEVSVCGLEIPGKVVVTLSVVKNVPLPTPMLENADNIYTLASALTLDDAAKLATRNMAHFIMNNTTLSLADAINVMSITGNVEVCQMVDPLKTCRFALPKSVASQLSLNIVGGKA